MPDEMQEFYRSMQKFLLKMEQKHGKLRYFLSRATAETSNSIDQVVKGVIAIFNTHKVMHVDHNKRPDLITERKFEPKIVQSYRCLLLNTQFCAQRRLSEDTLYGYLVDQWPPISPYLFVQIVWSLKCEELLVESVLHTPLELCLEILEMATKCMMELEFERSLRLTIDLIWNTYKRCFLLNSEGTQVDDLTERLQHLIANFQMLLDQLVDSRTIDQLPEQRLKYEWHGIIIKNIIRVIKMCTEVRLKGEVSITSQKFYALTFGNEYYCHLMVEPLKSILTTLDNELITLLLNQIKQVDCYTYIAWAEIDDRDNVVLTLQRAIAIECHYFMQFMEHDVMLWRNEHLRQCLEQLAGPNSRESILTLQELCNSIANGRPEGMKELIKRYREWDQQTLDFLHQSNVLLDKEDCQILFEYLNYKFATRYFCTEEEERNIRNVIFTIVMNRELADVYDIAITYMLRHFDKNFMESFYDESTFEDFIRRNVNMQEVLNLRLLLIFLLLSPKQVLSILTRIAIGSTEYSDVVFTPRDMLLVRPFLGVQRTDDCTYLAYLLKNVCLHSDTWDTKKFTDFLHVMLNAKVTNSDDLINNVFIPYLAEKPFDKRNINCMLINIHRIIGNCTKRMDIVALCTALTRKMSIWRKCGSMIPRILVNEVLANIMKVLDNYLYPPHRMSVMEKQMVMNAVMAHIEPLDKANLAPLAHMLHGNILDIISDYERRCFPVRNRLILERRNVQYIYEYATTLQLNREVFIRHMFLHATEVEYQTHSLELAIAFWSIFSWDGEMDGFDNVLRITMEAARVALEYPYEIPCDSFLLMLKYAVHFCRLYAKFDRLYRYEDTILRIVLKNLTYVIRSVQHTQYSSKYTILLQRLNRIAKNVNVRHRFQHIMRQIDEFIIDGMELIDVPGEPNDHSYLPSADIYAMHEAYRFVCACLMIPGREKHHRCIEKLERLIFEDEDYNAIRP